MTNPQWLLWARQLQTMAQTGLSYANDPYDIERYTAMRELAAEIAAHYANTDLPFVRELFAHDSGHPTPKVDVRAAVFQGETILLVRERSDGCWTLPGGWADPGESPANSVTREVREESGYEVRATKLLMFYDRDKHDHPPIAFHAYKCFFQCELLGGSAAHSSETDGVGFFRADEIPPLSLTRVTPAEIARCFEHYRNPTLPTDFD